MIHPLKTIDADEVLPKDIYPEVAISEIKAIVNEVLCDEHLKQLENKPAQDIQTAIGERLYKYIVDRYSFNASNKEHAGLGVVFLDLNEEQQYKMIKIMKDVGDRHDRQCKEGWPDGLITKERTIVIALVKFITSTPGILKLVKIKGE